MADSRSEHVVNIGGIDHVFLLTDEDAKKYPDAKKKSGAARAVADAAVKAQAAANKAYQGVQDK